MIEENSEGRKWRNPLFVSQYLRDAHGNTPSEQWFLRAIDFVLLAVVLALSSGVALLPASIGIFGFIFSILGAGICAVVSVIKLSQRGF